MKKSDLSVVWTVLAFVIVPLVTWLDWVTGSDLSSIIFYVIPIMVIAWFTGSLGGFVAIILSVSGWYLANVAFPSNSGVDSTSATIWDLGENFLVLFSLMIIVLLLRQSNEKLKHLARADFLTGLPNRRSLTDQLRRQIDQRGRFCLAFIEILGWDDLAFDVGEGRAERLLKDLATAGVRNLPLARWADTRFGLLLEGATGPTAAKRISELLEFWETEFLVPAGFALDFKVAIAACSGVDDLPPGQLLRSLSTRLITQPNQGAHRVEFFSFPEQRL